MGPQKRCGPALFAYLFPSESVFCVEGGMRCDLDQTLLPPGMQDGLVGACIFNPSKCATLGKLAVFEGLANSTATYCTDRPFDTVPTFCELKEIVDSVRGFEPEEPDLPEVHIRKLESKFEMLLDEPDERRLLPQLKPVLGPTLGSKVKNPSILVQNLLNKLIPNPTIADLCSDLCDRVPDEMCDYLPAVREGTVVGCMNAASSTCRLMFQTPDLDTYPVTGGCCGDDKVRLVPTAPGDAAVDLLAWCGLDFEIEFKAAGDVDLPGLREMVRSFVNDVSTMEYVCYPEYSDAQGSGLCDLYPNGLPGFGFDAKHVLCGDRWRGCVNASVN